MKSSSFAVALLLLCAPLGAAEKNAAPSAEEICTTHESRVSTLVRSGSLLDAIKAVADYERAVLQLHAAPTFELGLLQHPAHHLTLHSSFDGWTQESLKKLQIPDWLPTMGFDVLLALKGPGEHEKLVLIANDMGKLERRLGVKGEQSASGDFTDQQLLLGAQMMAGSFGAVKNQEFSNIGGRRCAVLQVMAPFGGPPSTVVAFGANRRIYVLALISMADTRAENEKKLFETLKSADFKFQPPNTRAIAETRAKVRNEQSIPEALRCVRDLVAAREIGAASDELSRIRVLLAERMPKPVIEGGAARHPAYGITLRNPDVQRWKLSVNSEGNMSMLFLEDRFSVTPSGIMVMVMNTVLTYGPEFVEAVTTSTDEEMRKNVLSGAGRGGLANVGGEIEAERYRIFKGMFAYEGIATANLENTKIKSICAANADYLLMIVQFVEARRFDAKAEEFEKILERSLDITTTAAASSPR